MLNKKLLQDAQQVVTSGLLGQGVKVVYDTKTPYADLRNKVMHLRPLPEEVSAGTMLHLRADCDHEMGHFLCSDPGALDDVRDPMLQLLTNAIEDGFVERTVSKRWFGCGENLRDSNEELINQTTTSKDTSEEHIRRLTLTALQLLTFGASRNEVENLLGPLVKEDLEAVADLIPDLQACDSTAESVRLAREVDHRWWWTDPERPKSEGSGEGEESGAPPEKGEGDSKSDDKSEDDPQDQDQGPRDDPQDDPQDNSDQDQGQDEDKPGPPPSEPEPKPDPKPEPDPEPEPKPAPSKPESATVSESRKKLAEKLSEGTLSAARKKIVTEEKFTESLYFARTEDDTVEVITPLARQSAINEFVESVRSVVPTLRRRLLMEFRGVGTRREFDMRSGEIDRASLHKVAIGNPRVFTTDVPHAVPDADVTLLVDLSGSMTCGTSSGRSRLYVASQAAFAFSAVLDLIGVENEVLGFTTHRHPDYQVLGAYTRIRPLRQLVIKPAGSTARINKAKFAAMAHFDGCSENIDGECVMWAAQRLAARNRKGMSPILIVLSDGEPASYPEKCSLLNRHLRETVKRIEKAGIHVIGVGIQTRSVKRFYQNNLVIDDVTDLVGTSYGILRNVLRKASRVR